MRHGRAPANSWLSYWDHGLDAVLEGRPTPVVRSGVVQQSGLRRERMNEKDLLAELTVQGVEDLREVKRADIENDGQVKLQAHRYDRSRPYLSEARRRALDGRALADYQASLESRIGRGWDVRTHRTDDGQGLVTVTAAVKGAKGQATMVVPMVHEKGEWRVDELRAGAVGH